MLGIPHVIIVITMMIKCCNC